MAKARRAVDRAASGKPPSSSPATPSRSSGAESPTQASRVASALVRLANAAGGRTNATNR